MMRLIRPLIFPQSLGVLPIVAGPTLTETRPTVNAAGVTFVWHSCDSVNPLSGQSFCFAQERTRKSMKAVETGLGKC